MFSKTKKCSENFKIGNLPILMRNINLSFETIKQSPLILKFFLVLFKQLFCNFLIFVELMQQNSAEFIFLVRVEGS